MSRSWRQPVWLNNNGVFHCLTLMPIHIPIPILIICRKAPLGPIPMVILILSYYENYLNNHLISINISVKLGRVPICIGIRIGIGSVETVLHIIVLAIWIGIGIGIGVGQRKHAIMWHARKWCWVSTSIISGTYDIFAVTEIKRNPTHIPSRRCRPRIVSRRRRSARSRSRTRRGTGSSRASRYSRAAPASR